METYVYIDGFNFYYRVVKGTPYKWLDFSKFCSLLLPANKIIKIKYFTAMVRNRPNDPHISNRQQIFLRALKTIPNLEIILGHFLQKPVTLPVARSSPMRFETVIRTEEKGSDVNLASHLVHDGHLRRFRAAVLITDDSDLAEPLRILKEELSLVTGILSSQERISHSLARHASFYKQIRNSVLKLSQFPEELRDATGIFHKPASW